MENDSGSHSIIRVAGFSNVMIVGLIITLGLIKILSLNLLRITTKIKGMLD